MPKTPLALMSNQIILFDDELLNPNLSARPKHLLAGRTDDVRTPMRYSTASSLKILMGTFGSPNTFRGPFLMEPHSALDERHLRARHTGN